MAPLDERWPYRADTGERLPGSDGIHVYLAVADCTDIERFLRVLHERCWIAGLGWYMVGAGGQLLDRSIVDRMVGAPERLVFEGGPILDPPLEQDRGSRRPVAVNGDILDTMKACPPLTIAETARLREMKAKAAHRLAPEAAKARTEFINKQASLLAKRTGMSAQAARKTIAQQCDGLLLPDIELPFDDVALACCTVADVLRDPDRFDGATLADPLEGVAYGIGKAKVMRRSDGTPWIHSFAHGRTVYSLKYDARAVRAAIDQADKAEVVSLFIRLVLLAELDGAELESLRNEVCEKAEMNKRTISQMVKEARAKQAAQRKEEARKQRLAARTDPRPIIESPNDDVPWLPVMGMINDVIGKVRTNRPVVRDIDDYMTKALRYAFPSTHAFATAEKNSKAAGSLPVPEQWGLRRLDKMQVAETIERYIDFVDPKDQHSVHLPMQFVSHYVQRDDDVLPTVVTVATLPIVLADGALLAPDGIDRLRGIWFEIQHELRAVVPQPRDCTKDAVRSAMEFLTEEWLCDVDTDYGGKCSAIAAGLSIIERSLLNQRPCFFITAGRRGGGKTTLATMLLLAVTGIHPAASAWSTNEDERRKAILAYFMYGASYLLWDNIKRGAQIDCPHVERSCTSAFYADRKLGVSEMVATAASAIHLFTGNNIAPRGDLASRSLHIRLAVDRPDPENRAFQHPDPIAWTNDHRAQIIGAMYTILLGNQMLETPSDAPCRTRFKMWWRLIGSAVEHAAALNGEAIDFRKLFLAAEEDEEETTALAEALVAMRDEWGHLATFQASHVACLINDDQTNPHSPVLRAFLFGDQPPGFRASTRGIGMRLRLYVDNPVGFGSDIMVLKANKNSVTKTNEFWVQVT